MTHLGHAEDHLSGTGPVVPLKQSELADLYLTTVQYSHVYFFYFYLTTYYVAQAGL